jgi:hypothetical protein
MRSKLVWKPTFILKLLLTENNWQRACPDLTPVYIMARISYRTHGTYPSISSLLLLQNVRPLAAEDKLSTALEK